MTDTLYGALAKAQGEMPNAVFNRVNPHFKNKYADLAALRDATLPALSKHGLCIVQYTDFMQNGENVGILVLRTRLAHSSGEYVEGIYPLPVILDKPQQMGSALTYARRYGWGTIIGVASEEDDDAESVGQGASDVTLGKEELSKAKSRPIYEALIKEMREITVPAALTKWGLENSPKIYSMHSDFQKWFRQEYQDHLTAIKGGTVKEQLKASLEAEEIEDA